MEATLVRVERSDKATRGVLVLDGRARCLTLERPWLDNARDVSCIPAGSYLCRRVQSPAFGETFEVTGVPGRTHILFHVGNRVADSKGCIVLGSAFGELGGDPAVLTSRKAVSAFMGVMEGVDEFPLRVLEA